MAGFLDRLLGRGAPEKKAREITLAEVTPLIEERKRTAEEEFGMQAEASRARLVDLIAHLQDLLKDLAAGEAEEKRPPRLEKVVKTSIPSFVGAMETILSRPLPGEPEALYEETAAMVKKIVRAMRGQGKYIAGMLPGEMKEIRITVDGMGGELNALTKSYGRLKESREKTGKVERAAGTVRELLAEKGDLLTREGAFREELEGLRAEKTDLEQRILDREGEPGYLALLGEEEELEALEAEEQELFASLRITSSSAASLLKRAEHEGGEEEVKKAIRKLRERLERCEIEEIEEVLPELSRWEEVMAAMAGEGKLSPKNRAEREILAGERRLSGELSGIIKRLRGLEGERREKRALISASPLRQEMRSDKERLGSILCRITGAEEELERAGAGIGALEEALPRRIESLNEKLTDLEERAVRVVVPTG